MINVVIPHVENRDWPEKLRYVLRSIEKNFIANYQVHIIGFCPNWCTNINHIFFEDIKNNTKAILNTGRKLKIAAKSFSSFVWTFDDIYFLRPITLKDLVAPKVNEFLGLYSRDQRQTGYWFDLLWNTYERCLELNLPGFSFETHLPYYFESEKLQRAFHLFRIESGEHLPQTAYSNLFFPGMENLIWDHEKVVFYTPEDFAQNPDFGDAKFLNHNDIGLTTRLKKKIKKLFPEKSKFEK